jgi:hypothetical protein
MREIIVYRRMGPRIFQLFDSKKDLYAPQPAVQLPHTPPINKNLHCPLKILSPHPTDQQSLSIDSSQQTPDSPPPIKTNAGFSPTDQQTHGFW